jgi:hypothetical protein
VREALKVYAVFRVDERDCFRRELCGESDIEGEAVRFSELLSEMKGEEGIYFKVRLSRSGELLHANSCRRSQEDPEEERARQAEFPPAALAVG